MSRITVSEQLSGCQAVSHKKLANNTVEWTDEQGNRYIRLHKTDIITFTSNGAIILDSGGWRTHTTKDRMNDHLPAPYRISQRDSIWYLNGSVFEDGITIQADGTVTGAGTEDGTKALKKSVKKYVDDFMTKLSSGEIPLPSAGDCWACHLDPGMSSDHVMQHIKENYHVPSLLFRACKEFGVSQAAGSWVQGICSKQISPQEDHWGKGVIDRQVRSALSRYVKRQVGLAA